MKIWSYILGLPAIAGTMIVLKTINIDIGDWQFWAIFGFMAYYGATTQLRTNKILMPK